MDESYIFDLQAAHDQGYALGMAHGLERAAQHAQRESMLATEAIGNARILTTILQRMPDTFLALATKMRGEVR